jgi:hypothetical protein
MWDAIFKKRNKRDLKLVAVNHYVAFMNKHFACQLLLLFLKSISILILNWSTQIHFLFVHLTRVCIWYIWCIDYEMGVYNIAT